LVKNAIIHNQKEGEVLIRLNATSLSLENSSDISEIPENKLFKRFSKNSSNSKSTGLGLSVVKAISEVSGLIITYSFSERHRFLISEKV
jgi:signal transduction histidine kinase